MDLQKMIADLQAEKDRLDEAILTLERLTAPDTRRRGRPARWLKDPAGNSTQNTSALPKASDPQHK